MEFLYDLGFWKSYLWNLVWNWFSLALVLLGANELSEWIFQTSFHWIHKHRGKIVLLLILFAQASVFYSLRQSAAVSPQPTPPLQLDIREHTVDSEGREELKKTKEKLAKAEATIHSLDPLVKPIASVKFTVSIDILGRNDPGHDIDSSMLLVLGVDGKGILWGTTTEHFESEEGHRRYIIDVPFDAAQMGQSVSTLSAANNIIMQFKESMVPLGTKISGGHVAMLVNNEITAVFDIPAQTIDHKANDRPVIVLRNIQRQISKVFTPSPPPTPDKE